MPVHPSCTPPAASICIITELHQENIFAALSHMSLQVQLYSKVPGQAQVHGPARVHGSPVVMKLLLTLSHPQAKRGGLNPPLQPELQHLRNVTGTQHTQGGETNRLASERLTATSRALIKKSSPTLPRDSLKYNKSDCPSGPCNRTWATVMTVPV